MRITDPRVDDLRSIEILRDLPSRPLRRLSGLVDEVQVDAGTVLINQGHLNRHAYFIRSGSVGIDVDGVRVATVAAGSIVGERTAIAHGLANATVTALEPTTVFAVDHRALLGTAAEDHDFDSLLRDLVAVRTNNQAA